MLLSEAEKKAIVSSSLEHAAATEAYFKNTFYYVTDVEVTAPSAKARRLLGINTQAMLPQGQKEVLTICLEELVSASFVITSAQQLLNPKYSILS